MVEPFNVGESQFRVLDNLGAWKNPFPSGILFLRVVNDGLHRRQSKGGQMRATEFILSEQQVLHRVALMKRTDQS